MLNDARPGTEAHRIQQEVLRRKQIAKGKGLDKLLSDTYHDIIKYYPARIENERNRRGVPTEVSSAIEIKVRSQENPKDNLDGVELVFNDKKYRITAKEKPSYASFNDDVSGYCELKLYLNEKLVFALSESIHTDEWVTSYFPFEIEAYASDDWVSDFLRIKDHQDVATRQSRIESAEDPERTRALREAFNISASSENAVDAKPAFNPQPSQALAAKLGVRQATYQKKSIFSKWWFWVAVVVIVWILFSSL
jgi:hypothetical protein